MKLKGRVALVTGAGSGMGKATALLFATEGAKVAGADISQATVENVAREIRKAGGEAIAIGADVAKSEDVQRMVAATLERLGPPNVLYNNAGIEGESDFLAEMSEAAFDKVIAINLRGVFLTSFRLSVEVRSRKKSPRCRRDPAVNNHDDTAGGRGVPARDPFDDPSAAKAQPDSGVSDRQALAFQRRRDRQLVRVPRTEQGIQADCIGTVVLFSLSDSRR
jgi:NAD(P)-dependent dehydrogenase (short-subunit alcohol dehydrogenase family)